MKYPSRIALGIVGSMVLATAVVAWSETENAVPSARSTSSATIPFGRERSLRLEHGDGPRPALDEGWQPSAPAPPAEARLKASVCMNPHDERSLMDHLHELAETDPASSLQWSRLGNERFEGTTDAAERAWIVVKSLVNMRRFDEARAEAAAMVEKYRGTAWAADVERHLLVNPLYPTDGNP